MPISSDDRFKDNNINLPVFPLYRTPKQRPDHPDNDSNKDHFMAMACLASLRSKDPTRQVMNSYIPLEIGGSYSSQLLIM